MKYAAIAILLLSILTINQRNLFMFFLKSHDAAESTASGIHIENIRADIPQFKRTYSARLDNRASIKIEMKTYSFGTRYKTGELTQPNGRWVLFDPDAIADKILDPALLPIIQKYVTEIVAIDKAYMATDPNEFTDEKGNKWRRQPCP